MAVFLAITICYVSFTTASTARSFDAARATGYQNMPAPPDDMQQIKRCIRALIDALQVRADDSDWSDTDLRKAYETAVWKEDDFLERPRRKAIQFPPLDPKTAAAYERVFGFGDNGAKYAPKLTAERLERRRNDQEQKFNITRRIMVRILASVSVLQIHSEEQSFEDRNSWIPFLERALAAVKGEAVTPNDLGDGASKADLRANQSVSSLSPSDEGQHDPRLQGSDSNVQTSRPARCFGGESEIEKAPSPLDHNGRAPSRDRGQPSISSVLIRGARRVSWTIIGAVTALGIQAAVVAANNWLTGNAIESAVGLFGAYAVPIISAVIGAIVGFALASRSQRSKKSIPLEE